MYVALSWVTGLAIRAHPRPILGASYFTSDLTYVLAFVLASGVEGTAGDLTSVLLGTGLPVFVIGLIFGPLYDRYQRLLPLIAAHWGIDAVVSVAAMVGLPL